jgi:hypothetical protein
MRQTVPKPIELVTNLCIVRPKFLHESTYPSEMVSLGNHSRFPLHISAESTAGLKGLEFS